MIAILISIALIAGGIGIFIGAIIAGGASSHLQAKNTTLRRTIIRLVHEYETRGQLTPQQLTEAITTAQQLDT